MNGTIGLKCWVPTCKSTTARPSPDANNSKPISSLTGGGTRLETLARIGLMGAASSGMAGSSQITAIGCGERKRVCIVYVKRDFGAEILQRSLSDRFKMTTGNNCSYRAAAQLANEVERAGDEDGIVWRGLC